MRKIFFGLAIALAAPTMGSAGKLDTIVRDCAMEQGVPGPWVISTGFGPSGDYAALEAQGAVTSAQAAGVNACAAARGVNTNAYQATPAAAPARAARPLVCPYPHRPSDSVFIGGAGYLTKDQVRRANGCL